MIEQKEMEMFVVKKKLFFTTDIDKNVRPKDRKEENNQLNKEE